MKYPLGLNIFRWMIIGAAVIAAGVGLWVGGTPSQERERRLDQQRIMDLQQIQSAIDGYWMQNAVLPTDLTQLQTSQYAYLQNVSDPVTGKQYEYRLAEKNAYELCSTFVTDNSSDQSQIYAYPNPKLWYHAVGHKCFSLKTQGQPVKPVPAIGPQQ